MKFNWGYRYAKIPAIILEPVVEAWFLISCLKTEVSILLKHSPAFIWKGSYLKFAEREPDGFSVGMFATLGGPIKFRINNL